ncbi:hypothetical protein [Polynucleobacter necessarius]|uniref:hypothetical protein n=1 Tax=Polynucleobacter necessarius TaxID=576610 RepID=UPI001E3F504F|nr:hypothetical protein [Polynucleobacter necessarius]
MIPVNSVLQVGHFPEIMRAEIDRRFTPTHHPDPQAPAPAGNFQAILIHSNTKLPEALLWLNEFPLSAWWQLVALVMTTSP